MKALLLTAAVAGAAALVAVAPRATQLSDAPRSRVSVLPSPSLDVRDATRRGDEVAVFAGGCFWGIEAVFEHLKGVKHAESGYAGGEAKSPSYAQVSSGSTGHAESVRVVFDPSQVSYGQLLQVFFGVAHNPTQLNRQGPDVGTQYRSMILYANDEQKRVAESYIAQLTAAHAFNQPIVTQLVPLGTFHLAEAYHQDYLVHHPNEPYIVYNDMPKLVALKQQFPGLYREGPAM